jgi:Na+/phosphate symporter
LNLNFKTSHPFLAISPSLHLNPKASVVVLSLCSVGTNSNHSTHGFEVIDPNSFSLVDMEALAGLAVFGVACNVMQTIHFSLEACAVCKRVWQGKSPAPELDSQRAAVQKAANDLQQSLVSSSQTQGQPAETELQKIANDIVPIAKKLEKELNNCKSSAIKYLAVKKHKINKLSESLRSLQGIMELRILMGLRY